MPEPQRLRNGEIRASLRMVNRLVKLLLYFHAP
jgi:hypothetical protein